MLNATPKYSSDGASLSWRSRTRAECLQSSIGIAEVPATVGDGTIAVASRWAVGDDGVLKHHRAVRGVVIDTAAQEGRAIAGEGTVANGQRASIGDAATFAPVASDGAIARKGAIAYGQRPVVIGLDERVLRRVLCSIAVAQDSVRQIEGKALVSQDQLVEGR